MHGLFEQAFNAGDIEALMALYEPDAALVPQPGAIAEGSAAIRESLRWFLDRRGRISLDTKLVLRVGDLAYLANRWSLTGGTMPDGSPAQLGASGCRPTGRRLPAGAGRGVRELRGELVDDGHDEGVRDGAAADGGGEDGHGRLSIQRGLRERRGAVRSA